MMGAMVVNINGPSGFVLTQTPYCEGRLTLSRVFVMSCWVDLDDLYGARQQDLHTGTRTMIVYVDCDSLLHTFSVPLKLAY